MASLGSLRIGSPHASRHLLMLHGIYGWGRNWAAIARRLAAARPDYACVLLDLPHHGESGPGAHGDTVRGQADDVAAWVEAEGLTIDAVLGHSFGGKVALALADRWRDRELRVWIVDSTPGTRDPSGSAWSLLHIVRELPTAFPSREAFVTTLTNRGWATGIAQWMATNLERRGETFAWRLDFDVMERLMRDFYATDLWTVIEPPAPGHTFHFIKASDSAVMSDDAVRRVEAAATGRVVLHHLDGSHWIHAEKPDEVAALLAQDL
ncbi:MAG: hypothetical protein ABS36_03125 [Acidobacteria bacterium SCN 69-37]|nr:MAG: hypothetical protein ABS36_03125 [Acidobacteria bacterium SCN 69-37]